MKINIKFLKLITKKKTQINDNDKEKVLKLKNSHYKHSMSLQREWYAKNLNTRDLQNLLFYKKELVGYNCLRFIKYNTSQLILFDTLVIKKKYRRKSLSTLILEKSNLIIKKKNKIGILFCLKEMIPFYEKNKWKKLKKKYLTSSKDSQKELYPMIFNCKKIIRFKISI